MNHIEYFFDPTCPFAWLTSRWVTEVSERSDLGIEWRFISLQFLNEGVDAPAFYRRSYEVGLELLRVAAAVRRDHGNAGVASIYAALGTRLHTEGRSAGIWEGDDPGPLLLEALDSAGLEECYVDAMGDRSHDGLIRSETELAIGRTGRGVGTPGSTFDPAQPDTTSFFGPVLNRVPRGDEAIELWDGLATVARIPGFSELKRSLRGSLELS